MSNNGKGPPGRFCATCLINNGVRKSNVVIEMKQEREKVGIYGQGLWLYRISQYTGARAQLGARNP